MFVLFDEIYRTQGMTRAAERLDLSEPTASIWLAKLRSDGGALSGVCCPGSGRSPRPDLAFVPHGTVSRRGSATARSPPTRTAPR